MRRLSLRRARSSNDKRPACPGLMTSGGMCALKRELRHRLAKGAQTGQEDRPDLGRREREAEGSLPSVRSSSLATPNSALTLAKVLVETKLTASAAGSQGPVFVLDKQLCGNEIMTPHVS